MVKRSFVLISAIFITGLTVGGLTCLAVQGGLLASVIAGREEESCPFFFARVQLFLKNPLDLD